MTPTPCGRRSTSIMITAAGAERGPGRRILCLGDSNTYGYDPRNFLGGRYGPEGRWPEILARKTGWQVFNCGENGREIPHSEAERRYIDGLIRQHQPLDLLMILLGSNDVLRSYPVSARKAADRMAAYLDHLKETFPEQKLLLLSPGPVEVPEEELAQAIRDLEPAYRALAAERGIPFASLGDWSLPLTYDGVHLSEAGHRALAENLLKLLK